MSRIEKYTPIVDDSCCADMEQFDDGEYIREDDFNKALDLIKSIVNNSYEIERDQHCIDSNEDFSMQDWLKAARGLVDE